MGDAVSPPARPRRLWNLAALVAALLVGVVLGVVADRVYLGVLQRTPDERLYGDWVADHGVPFRFRRDGTFDSAVVTSVDRKVTQEEPLISQYRWVTRDAIELYDPFVKGGWVTRKLVFEGDQLTLLGDNGQVRRLTRKKD
jgi:hypothetical protein